MNEEQLAVLTEKELHDLRYGCEGTNHPLCELTEAHLTALADARLEMHEARSEIAQLKTDWASVCAIADERKTMCWEAIYKARALEAEVARLTKGAN
ncbi:MAG TPA: hypothetical protein DCP69_01420 [Candidatus Omnitrophica bacterium]|nr:hypothetical protein [Candidatus Omnitrophota bacterium]